MLASRILLHLLLSLGRHLDVERLRQQRIRLGQLRLDKFHQLVMHRSPASRTQGRESADFPKVDHEVGRALEILIDLGVTGSRN
jgi:hypothetical protein